MIVGDPNMGGTAMDGVAEWLTRFSREVVAGENRALLAMALAGIGIGFAITRRKLAGWMLVPILAGAIWYGVIRWVQIRNGA